jgi:hypothetical protein
VFLALGVEHFHFEHQADEGGFGGDESCVERFATGRTVRDADLDVDVLQSLVVEPIASSIDSTSRTSQAASIATR